MIKWLKSESAINYGPAPHDCDIIPRKLISLWVFITWVLPKLLLDLGVIS